ncbi:MAG: filamentous hemagglutinin N-terminal domain-containing protein [Rivularia sp. (in: Bacteria)]|nr:filamentous hemagglutinin N-terminal domain-containing protein [Rivularia sp. MS3]
MSRKYIFSDCLRLTLAGITGCLGVFLITNQALAQQSDIIPDKTLGGENSRVNFNVDINGINADKIDGGARRNSNLFHSFQEFNINNGQALYFTNPDGVENIFTRVTGGNASNIFGTLGVDGAANLFLINPNGIVFGENASLDLQGSFVGTTASGLEFSEQGKFSATNPEIPGSLTVNPSALFFNQVEATGGIINKSRVPAGISRNGNEITGLRVPDGKSLLLVGGEIKLDGGGLIAPEGNIGLASVTVPGMVDLDISGDTFSLDIPEDLERGDITLVNKSYLIVAGTGGGDIAINADNLEISDSTIFAGLEEASKNTNVKSGDININATGSIELQNYALISNVIQGKGNAGDININAGKNISLIGNGFPFILNPENDNLITGILSFVANEAVGNAGNIQLTANNIYVNDGASISSRIFGQGNAGNITINAKNTVSFDKNGNIGTDIFSDTFGEGGDIIISTITLSLTNGGQLNSNIFGQGNAGSIFIEARDNVNIDGFLLIPNIAGIDGSIVGIDGVPVVSGIQSNLIGIGKGGDIEINTGSLLVNNLASISASTNAIGNAGNITINARETVTFSELGHAQSASTINAIGNGADISINAEKLLLRNGGFLQTSGTGKGNAGNIFLDVRDTITLDGFSKDKIVPSSVNTFSDNGNAGNIDVKTGSLFLTNGGFMGAYLVGQNNQNDITNAGNITINARDKVKIDGEVSSLLSNLFSGVGKAGNIEITADFLSISNSGEINSSTSGEGNAGNITFNANTFEATNGGKVTSNTNSSGDAGTINLNIKDKIILSGSELPTGIFANTSPESTGKGGSIFIDPRLVIIENGAAVSVESNGNKEAGNITLQAGTLQLDNGFITAETASSQGGDINLQIGELLLLRNESQITTTAGTAEAGGNGGNIDIDSKFIISIPEENSDITANAFSGNGGRVDINSNGIFGIETQASLTNKSDITASSETGISGETNINTADTSSIQNSFTELSPNIDTDAIIANSCIARGNKKQENSFRVLGNQGLPSNRPGNVLTSEYITGEVRNIDSKNQVWKKGNPIVEPQGLYRMKNGELLLSRECSN